VTALGWPDALNAAFVIRSAVIACTLLLWRRHTAARYVAFGGSTLASLVTGTMAVSVLRTATPVEGVLFAHRASGMTLQYAVDGLSAWFLLILSVVAIPVAVFSIDYLAHPPFDRRCAFVGISFNVLVGAVEMVFSASDIIGFLFAWELTTLSTAALVTTEHEERTNRWAAFLYLAMSHVGTGCLIAAFMMLSAASGSVSFSAVLSGHVPLASLTRNIAFALFFVGFGVKAGVVPLHLWLPEAHPAAPSSISALLSGVIIKTGVYGLVRVCAFGLGAPDLSWGVLVLIVGALSAVLGVLYALVQHDLKRLLAYHSIENIGIILLGLGAAMIGLASDRRAVATIGITASLYHVLNHAVFKALLFLGAGGVVMATGTRQIEQFGGLIRRMSTTAVLFLVGAMAISGLPILNGFASEWLTFQAFLYGFFVSSQPLVHFLFPIGSAILALTTALAAACFVKAFGITFLALPRSAAAAAAHESPAMMLTAQAVLALACVVLGLFPGFVVQGLAPVLASLHGVQSGTELTHGLLGMTSSSATFDHVVPMAIGMTLAGALGAAFFLTARRGHAARRVPTWGCGGDLDARTEYTATAFSKPLLMIFKGIYRPTREVATLAEVSPYFPRAVHYRSEIEPTFERYVYRPVVGAVMRAATAMKMLQAGSLHAYLAYVIVLVVSLVLLVWWGTN
jgi:hydrogenase-4 component B